MRAEAAGLGTAMLHRCRYHHSDGASLWLARVAAAARISGLTLVAGLIGVALAGCHTTGAASPASTGPASAGPASAGPASTSPPSAGPASARPSPGLSIPGTHRSTTEYRISSPVSTVIVISHAGNVTVTGGGGSATSVTQQATYSKTPPVTTRAVSGGILTITYSCPVQLVCGVSYVVQVPRDAAVQATAEAGAIRLSGLAGNVTAKADVGLIDATGLTGASVGLTTEAGGITAAFATPPAAVQAVARVGAITLRVPGGVSYRVAANAHVGKATISVPQSSSSAHVITATTDVGAITVRPAA
jgi:hypothetical protein